MHNLGSSSNVALEVRATCIQPCVVVSAVVSVGYHVIVAYWEVVPMHTHSTVVELQSGEHYLYIVVKHVEVICQVLDLRKVELCLLKVEATTYHHKQML